MAALQNNSIAQYLIEHGIQKKELQMLDAPDIVVVCIYFILVIAVGLMVSID